MNNIKVKRFYNGILSIFGIYLMLVIYVGFKPEVPAMFYYGFWLTLGALLGFLLCLSLVDGVSNKKNPYHEKDRLN